MSIKITRAIKTYDGFKGQQTVSAVLAQVPDELIETLTGKQIGQIMSAINKAYHNGGAATGTDVIDGDYVWIDVLDAGYDLDVLRRLKKTETRTDKIVAFNGNLCDHHDYRNCHSGELTQGYKIPVHVPRDHWCDWSRTEYTTSESWELAEKEA